mmetsp:Transcript_15857/g.51196  ORF Transcript_15857/g.51196 Transcript_15857/m.51196 type:complete len:209 (-) Transcript_15857:313-939(-)
MMPPASARSTCPRSTPLSVSAPVGAVPVLVGGVLASMRRSRRRWVGGHGADWLRRRRRCRRRRPRAARRPQGGCPWRLPLTSRGLPCPPVRATACLEVTQDLERLGVALLRVPHVCTRVGEALRAPLEPAAQAIDFQGVVERSLPLLAVQLVVPDGVSGRSEEGPLPYQLQLVRRVARIFPRLPCRVERRPCPALRSLPRLPVLVRSA